MRVLVRCDVKRSRREEMSTIQKKRRKRNGDEIFNKIYCGMCACGRMCRLLIA